MSGDCNQADGNSDNNTRYCIGSSVFADTGDCIYSTGNNGGTRNRQDGTAGLIGLADT